MQHNNRSAHLVRGVIAATLATFVAMFAHVIGGGEPPALLGTLVAWVLATAVSVLLVGRNLSVFRLTLAVSTSQALFHTLFMLGTPSVLGNSPVARSLHEHASSALVSAVPAQGGVALTGDLTMWASHAFAVAVTVLALWRGEVVLRQLASLGHIFQQWIRARLNTCTPIPALLPHHHTSALATTAVWSVLAQVSSSDAERRGPPVRF